MEITKFTYSGPDRDDDLNFEMEATIENDTEYVIELIKTNCLIVNSDGICVGGSWNDEQDAYIEPRESGSLRLSSGYVQQVGIGGKLGKIKGVVDVVLYRRDFQKMGELDVPEDHNSCSFIEKIINIGGIIDVMGATCTRRKPDDDGNTSLELKVGIRNVSDSYVDRVKTRMILLDQEEAQIEVSEDYNPVPPKTGCIFSPSTYVKSARLRNCTVRLTVWVYLPVADKTVESIAVKG